MRGRRSALRRTSVGLLAGVVLFAVGFVGGEAGVGHGSPVSGAAASRFGLYPGYAGVAQLRSLETFVGHPANYVVQFADIHEAAFTSSVWGEVTKAGAFQTLARQITLVESIPLAFGDFLPPGAAGRATARANLQATVDGAHDAEYRVAANYLRNGGYPDAIIRLGWEFDGDWMPWSAPGNEALWIDAYRHVADIFRSVSSVVPLRLERQRRIPPERPRRLPGRQLRRRRRPRRVRQGPVHGLGPGRPRVGSIRCRRSGSSGTTSPTQRDFAIAHGKPVSFPEWALTGVDGNVTSNVGGDDPTFIQGMSDWINGLPANGPGSLSYQSYFNEDTEDGHHRIDANYFPMQRGALQVPVRRLAPCQPRSRSRPPPIWSAASRRAHVEGGHTECRRRAMSAARSPSSTGGRSSASGPSTTAWPRSPRPG